MKNAISPILAGVFMFASLSASSQKYKTAADTAKLNEEIIVVSKDVADLTSKLTTSQNNLYRYQDKASEANADAQNTAQKNNDKASKATNGDVKDAKRAKREAKKSVRDAKSARSANNKLNEEQKNIAKLYSQLQKRQERLRELESMRSTIRNTPQ
jgi:DNA repair exonuclease SbcCD ATPase subunit